MDGEVARYLYTISTRGCVKGIYGQRGETRYEMGASVHMYSSSVLEITNLLTHTGTIPRAAIGLHITKARWRKVSAKPNSQIVVKNEATATFADFDWLQHSMVWRQDRS